ncbi:hypothetical protein C8Q74DRAFT_1193682, partial [Fomes fomentarius]
IVCGVVLFIYECILTLDGEVQYFWKRRVTGPSVLYILSKYLTLGNYVVCLAIYLPVFTDEVCGHTPSFITDFTDESCLLQRFAYPL